MTIISFFLTAVFKSETIKDAESIPMDNGVEIESWKEVCFNYNFLVLHYQFLSIHLNNWLLNISVFVKVKILLFIN